MFARMARESTVDGASDVVRLRALAAEGEVLLTLWDSREGAEGAGRWYEVEDDRPLADAGSAPQTAGVYYFDGPMSQAHRDAAQAANTRRIHPAMADHPGGVRVLTLWQPDERALVVVVLTTSLAALEDAQRKVQSMELLPDEDPALLPGPSRVEVYRVLPERSAVS